MQGGVGLLVEQSVKGDRRHRDPSDLHPCCCPCAGAGRFEGQQRPGLVLASASSVGDVGRLRPGRHRRRPISSNRHVEWEAVREPDRAPVADGRYPSRRLRCFAHEVDVGIEVLAGAEQLPVGGQVLHVPDDDVHRSRPRLDEPSPRSTSDPRTVRVHRRRSAWRRSPRATCAS